MKLKQVLPFLVIIMVLSIFGCKKEEIAVVVSPTVTATSPLKDATGILSNSVTATFSESMDPATITSSSFTVQKGTVILSGTVSYEGTTATFIPTENLGPNSLYSAAISTAVTSVKGEAMEAVYVWTFTTGTTLDVTLPTVSLTDPLNNATGVALNKVISATFSETMNPLTITSSTFSLKQGLVVIPGAVTCVGTKASFTPTANLDYNKIYSATVTTGAKDLAGNALGVNLNFSFTSVADMTMPTVMSTNPLNNATGVPRNKVISLVFSEAMDPLTISSTTLTLKQGTTPIAGIVAYSGTTATFTPSSDLAALTLYTAAISAGAKDSNGNALTAGLTWSFTTGGTIPGVNAGPAVVDLGASGNYVILAKTGISNISTSVITGDLGLSPAATSYVTGLSITNATGYATSVQVTGKIYAADMADPTPINLTTAVNNMITAYNDAAGRSLPDYSELGTGNIGGKTLIPGLYKWTSSVTLPSSVTISGGANDVWIFQISGDLLMSNAVNITLIGGAQAKNIFWQVAGQVTIGTTSHFEGVILSMTGINFQTGSSLKGRALAQTAVTLDGSNVTKP
jgi:hypothetical protein